MGEQGTGVSRRQLLGGLGAVGGASVLGVAVPGLAGADEGPNGGAAGPGGGAAGPAGTTRASPVTSTISSAAQPGVTYVFRSMFEFSPEDPAARRQWSPNGVYTIGTNSSLWTAVDIPPGALVYDVEWYTTVTVAGNVALGRLWRPDTGSLFAVVADTALATSLGPIANRTVVPAAGQGPHPHGTQLNLGVYAPTDASVRVTGVRVGFQLHPSGLVLLPAAVRAYDTRTSGVPLAAGSSRAIPLTGQLPIGATGALFELSVFHTGGIGTLRVGKAGITPTAVAIQWAQPNDKATSSVTTAVSAARAITVQSVASTGATDFTIDVVGYYR